jgi:hypothetical protein
MITPRQKTKQDLRKPLNSRASTGVGPSEGPRVINTWARSGDATQRPEFDHGLRRKQKKLRPKWPF